MFTTTQRLLLVATILAASSTFLTACSEEAGTPTPTGDAPTVTEVEQPARDEQALDEPEPDGQASALPIDPDKAKAEHTQRLKEMNTYGRGLLESFEARVYSPLRDANLRKATAVIDVHVSDVRGRFEAAFDASKPTGERVLLTPDPANVELPRGTERQVLKWAQLAFEGAYREVVSYLPPTDLLVTPSKDQKHRVVTARPHLHDVQVSYSVSEEDMVMIRGTSIIPDREIVHFAWEEWRGRQLLESMTFLGTESVIAFEYDDKDTEGAVLLQHARLHQGEKVFDAAFRYANVTTGE